MFRGSHWLQALTLERRLLYLREVFVQAGVTILLEHAKLLKCLEKQGLLQRIYLCG